MQQSNKRNAIRSVPCGEPGWYQAYFVAMCESDRNQAVLEINRARRAIRERILELRRLPSRDPGERQDLSTAMTYLGILLMHVGKESGALLWD